MRNDNVFESKKPGAFVDDQITRIIRQGARKLLAQALEVEIELFINQYAELKDASGKQQIVRNGYRPEREIQSGIGPVPVKALVLVIGIRTRRKGFISHPRYCRRICVKQKAWKS
jgi:putative transposase